MLIVAGSMMGGKTPPPGRTSHPLAALRQGAAGLLERKKIKYAKREIFIIGA